MTTNQTPDSAKPSELEELIERLIASSNWLEYGAKPSGVPLPSGPDLRRSAALLADSDTNAPWLTEAHMLCTDHGIPHGNITERIKALRDKLAVGKIVVIGKDQA